MLWRGFSMADALQDLPVLTIKKGGLFWPPFPFSDL